MSSHGHSHPLPGFDALTGVLKQWREKSGFILDPLPVMLAGLAVLFFCLVFAPGIVGSALSMALFLSPLWLPLLLVRSAMRQWLILKRSEFIASQEMVLLELIPPRSYEKTPLAMEAVIAGLHIASGESTWWGVYMQGKVRPSWTLEIASTEGRVHFYIQTRAGFRRQVEAQFYAQYPGAQIVEAKDYARAISGDHHEWELWGCDFTKKKEDPYPIRTYVDYGLDKVAKEHEQVDPLANLIEFMGSLGKGEHLWIQMGIRVHKGEKYGTTNKAGKPYTWRDEATELVMKMRERLRTMFRSDDPEENNGPASPTKAEAETMAAIERNVSKLAFDVGIRGIYLGRPESYSGVTVPVLLSIFKQFNSENHNSLGPTGWMAIFNDYPWELAVEKRKSHIKHELMDAYRRRLWFYPPYESPYSVMSTEELATIFHIPSAAVPAPSLPRIQSTTGEAPPGLPT
jgi:hypothetical protein